jgi:lysophospholipase L1-like esterase
MTDGDKTAHERSRSASIVSGLTLLFVASLICFGLGEVVVRLLFKQSVVLFPRYHAEAHYGPFTLRHLEPSTRFWHTSPDGSWEFRTNAQGFRDDEDWSVEKPPEQIRVLVLGDSATEGFEARQEQTFSAVMERALRRRGFDAKVLNTGISGFSTAEELAYLENEGIRYAPDAVVLGFFANDFEDNLKAGLFTLKDGSLVQEKTEHIPGVRALAVINAIPGLSWLSQNSYLYSLVLNTVWEAAKRRILQQSRAQFATEYAVPQGEPSGGLETGLTLKLLERMHAFCRSRGIPLIVVDVPHPKHLFLDPSVPQREVMAFRSSVPDELTDEFRRHSDAYLPSVELLAPWAGVAEIHVKHGQRHISELTHLVLGTAAAHAVAAHLAAPPTGAARGSDP